MGKGTENGRRGGGNNISYDHPVHMAGASANVSLLLMVILIPVSSLCYRNDFDTHLPRQFCFLNGLMWERTITNCNRTCKPVNWCRSTYTYLGLMLGRRPNNHSESDEGI